MKKFLKATATAFTLAGCVTNDLAFAPSDYEVVYNPDHNVIFQCTSDVATAFVSLSEEDNSIVTG